MVKTSAGRTALGGLEKRLVGSSPEDPDVPGSVRKAVRLMLWGGAVTGVVGVFLVIATIADKNALTDSHGKKLTSGELASGVVSYLILYLILVVLWVVMARLNRAGRSWARFAATALAILSTINAYSTVNSLTGSITLTVTDIVFVLGELAIWILGVLAVILLWRAESSAYFRERAAAR